MTSGEALKDNLDRQEVDLNITEDEHETIARIKRENNRKILRIDSYINKLWSRRVLMSALINISIALTALYNGTIFIVAVILSALFHTVDKCLDYNVHKLHMKKDYAKYG